MTIAVVRFSSLGDVVLTLPVFRELRRAYPDAELVAVTKEAFADAYRTSPDVSQCLPLLPGESWWSMARRLRDLRPDVVVDLHGNARARLISLFSGAARVVRYRKAALARRLFVRWRWTLLPPAEHTLDRYLETLRRLDPARFSASTRQPHRILLIQTAFLGDAVLTTPLLDPLRERYPEARVDVLVTPETADIFRAHPAVTDVIVWDKRGQGRTWSARRRLVGRLREGAYDVALLPHRSLTSALFAWLSGIPRRIGFDRGPGRWLLTETVPFRWGTHDVDRNVGLLAPLAAVPSRPTLALQPAKEALSRMDERLRAAGWNPARPLIGINAGSVWATKRWLPERFGAVADRLMEEDGCQVLLIGSAKDAPVVEQVRRAMKRSPIDMTGQTRLAELIALISRCAVFLTNDSGPMHIAVACGVPTVALFGPTTRELGFFPYGPGHRVIEKPLACRPCGLHGAARCPLGHFECMKQITVDEVADAVRRQLKSRVAA